MAEGRRYGISSRLDIEQILLEAQHRWLRPAEVCEILRNYRKFQIAPDPPNKPPSGSLFLFDRKVLRYFRKDGHNWRKKKDGKTVREAHERLKAVSMSCIATMLMVKKMRTFREEVIGCLKKHQNKHEPCEWCGKEL